MRKVILLMYNNEGNFIPETQNPLLVTVGGANNMQSQGEVS